MVSIDDIVKEGIVHKMKRSRGALGNNKKPSRISFSSLKLLIREVYPMMLSLHFATFFLYENLSQTCNYPRFISNIYTYSP